MYVVLERVGMCVTTVVQGYAQREYVCVCVWESELTRCVAAREKA